MNDHTDPVSMTPARQAAARAQLVAVVDRRLSMRRPSTPVLVTAAVVVGAAASIGAVTLLSPARVSDPYTVECRMTLDPDEEGNYVSMTTPVTIVDGVTRTLPRPALENVIDICAQMVSQGWPPPSGVTPSLGGPSNPTDPPASTVCVADDGHAVVLPSADPGICNRVGLAPSSG